MVTAVVPYNATVDLWYQYWKDAACALTPSWWALLGLHAARAGVGLLAASCNAALVWVTVRNKQLHGICNWLIALDSFLAFPLSIFSMVPFLAALFVHPFIPYQLCFWLAMPPVLGSNLAQMTMLLTGIDRAFAVLFPIRYKVRSKQSAALVVALILSIYLGYVSFIYYNILMDTDSETVTMCQLYDIARGSWSIFTFYNGSGQSIALTATYGLVWASLHIRKKQLQPRAPDTSNNNSAAVILATINRRLIRSLLIIVGLNLAGVLYSNVLRLLYNFVSVDALTRGFVNYANSYLTIVVYGANAPVLYFISVEYRNAFNKEFPRLESVFCKPTRVVSLQQRVMTPQPAGTSTQVRPAPAATTNSTGEQ